VLQSIEIEIEIEIGFGIENNLKQYPQGGLLT